MEIEPGINTGLVVRVFGQMGVDFQGSPISIGGPRQHRLLALLTIRAGSIVGNDWLEENLWGDDERPARTVIALRTGVSRLRTALPEVAQDWIETAPGGYRFTPPADVIEHQRFAQLRGEARRARDLDDPLLALGFLDQALALWRGQPFRELEDLDWARAETEQLGLDRLEMLEERWESALALGRHTQITGELAVFTAEHNLRDRAAQQYALALHRSGRTVEALRVIADHRRVLVDVGGLEPSPAMVELEAALLSDDTSLRVDKVGRPLRGYRLIEQVGSGAFSVVWRALQPSVEREVAIKQIRPELASQPDFIRRFEAEARIIARIEHPHIVPLIDFWRDPDSAYLVMRWLPGGTLERRLDDGPLSLDQTMQLARQIGAALTAAHARGVVHRDVKAANVLFDDQGNAFLADFGIALEATRSGGPEAALSQGSPAYASPEQIRRQPLGPEADVFSFGIVLFESLTGTLPFPATASLDELVEHQLNDPIPLLSGLRADLPQSIIDAVATATAKDARDRFPSIAEFVRALEPATSETTTAPPVQVAESASDTVTPEPDSDIANPYLGLRAFEDGDADRFFGRESLVHELVGRLSGHSVSSRCVVVVGPSGSGKSSVVRAGLMPALRAGAVPGSSEWFTTTMVPGTDPYESLEAALLRIAVNPPPSLIEQLRDGKRGILRGIRRCVTSDDDRVVVAIDQFEEIFTGQTTSDAFDFLDALSVAVEDPSSPLRLVATLRADYYDRPLEHPTFARILSNATVTATPLAPDELERAIVEPARRVGVELEPGLAARLAAETQGQPSPLPLLQYTLSELFDRRVGDEVPLAAHAAIGGVTGALASRAEALYAEADDPQRLAIRNTFGRMTNPGEASADLRRRVPIADLGNDPATTWVTKQFGAARLITFDRDDATREPTIEVAHEALLREWPRLVSWLDEDRDLLRSTQQIATAADTWDAGGRDLSDLYRGGRLESAVGLAINAPDRLRVTDTEFIDASRAVAVDVGNAEQRRVRRLRQLVAGVGAALVLALIAGGLAVVQRNDAQDATAQAELASLITQSVAVAVDDDELAILLALEAHRRSPERETELAVLRALATGSDNPLVEESIELERGASVEFNGGVAVLTDLGTYEVESIDLATGERAPVPLLVPDGVDFRAVNTSVDATGFRSISTDGQIARWENGVMVEHINPPGDDTSNYMARSDGFDWFWSAVQRLDEGVFRMEVHFVNATPGDLEVLRTIDGTHVTSGASDRFGTFRLLFDDGMLRSFDSTGQLFAEIDTGLRLNRNEGTGAAITDDGGMLALGGDTGVVVVETATGSVTRLPAFQDVRSLSFARDDTLLVIGGADGTLRLWDVEENVTRGVLWRGPEAINFGTSYDVDTGSLWITESKRLIKLGLDPDVVLKRACEAVSRDLTQEEWDRFVPGGGPVISACPGANG